MNLVCERTKDGTSMGIRFGHRGKFREMAAMKKEAGCRNRAGAVSPELEINLCCARALIDSAAKERVRFLVRKKLDWAGVAALAARHRLSPIVYEIVAGSAQDLISPGQLKLLRQAASSSTAHGMTLVGELLRLHPLFEAAKIPAVPYKGPILAGVAYGSFIRREYSDLDFAVPQQFIPEAAAVIKSAGYRPLFDPREAHAGQNGFAPGQYSFLLDSPELLAELHTERTLRYFPNPLDFPDLTRRLMTVEISGQRLRTFSIEDTLVMLCVHGTKHFWERLGWVLDIAKLVAVREVDWTLLLEIAAKMESTRVLLLGLSLAHDLFDVALPDRLREQICRDRAVRELADQVYDQYAGGPGPGGGVLPRAVFRFRSRDGIGQGLRHMARLAMTPTERDRQTVCLPGWLTPLYTLVRPWRLLREYGLGSKRR
jgi:Uncharacterised nucleotidyltransferase